MEKVFVGLQYYKSVKEKLGAKHGSVWGIDLVVSKELPFPSPCRVCNGTGEGTESTYCRSCGGTGGHTTIGAAVQRGRIECVFTEKWPRKFEPSFPANTVAVPQMCRGLV